MVRRSALLLSAAARLLLLPPAAYVHSQPGLLEGCAAEGEKSKQCGGLGGKKPMWCCAELGCNGKNSDCVRLPDGAAGIGAESSTSGAATAAGSTVTPPTPGILVPGVAEPEPEKPKKPDKLPTGEDCAGFGERALGCGDLDPNRPPNCCRGYMCYKDKFPEEAPFDDLKGVKCINIDDKTAPLKPILPIIQDSPFDVSDKIAAMGTAFGAAGDFGTVKLRVPDTAKEGTDLLVIYIAGSGSVPTPPSGGGWTVFSSRSNKSDLNLLGYYKKHDGSTRINVLDGKNTFVILTVVRGVDTDYPIVDVQSVKNSYAGKDGRAVAPPACGVPAGIAIITYVYDDPHVAQVLTKDGGPYRVLVTTNTGTKDGMAAFVSSVDDLGYTFPVLAAAAKDKGGGNDLTMTTTFRPAGDSYGENPCAALAPESSESDAATALAQTSVPTSAPSRKPTVPPTEEPTLNPTEPPTEEPTLSPTTILRTSSPVASPTRAPSDEPTTAPSRLPTTAPTGEPTATPTVAPTGEPTAAPTVAPTAEPTKKPSDSGSASVGRASVASVINSSAAAEGRGSLSLQVTAVTGILAGMVLMAYA